MLIVVCVLRSGGEYTPAHVAILQRHIAANLETTHRFVCMTDLPGPVMWEAMCEVAPLIHGWPGWWSKIELFRPGVLPDGQKFYIDLDTIVVRNIDDLVRGHSFTVLRNFWADDRIGSGLMAWGTDLSSIYHRFAADSEKYMREYVTTERWGDQGFIRFNSPISFERWQDRYSGKIVSFKRHCIPVAKVPDGAAIVCFHGKPRPWQLNTFQRRWFSNARSLSSSMELARA